MESKKTVKAKKGLFAAVVEEIVEALVYSRVDE